MPQKTAHPKSLYVPFTNSPAKSLDYAKIDDENGKLINKLRRKQQQKLSPLQALVPALQLPQMSAQLLSAPALAPSIPANINSTKLHQIYDNNTNNNNIDIQFSRSSVGGSKYLVNAHTNVTPEGCDLIFESRFESGNLAKAIKITPVYYELYLRPDLYTNKHTQWFYFRVTNTRKDVPYRLVHYLPSIFIYILTLCGCL